MGSVLIKGMDMPKTCRQCFLRANGCKERKYNEGRPNTCPISYVPTPHGRLIDADALIKRDKFYWALSDECYLKIRDIKDEPTVIEAEE